MEKDLERLLSGAADASTIIRLRTQGVSLGSLLDWICDALRSFGRYPRAAEIWGEGKAVYEGTFLVLDDECVRVVWQRALATDPYTLAESLDRRFHEIEAGVKYFIQQEYGASIDGVPIRG